MFLKNKKVLITAGPTWVPIDNVRVISNIATGETGISLAKELARKGCGVTLVLGPVGNKSVIKNMRVIPFKFFDELSRIIKKEVKTGNYDVVIQTAAVSDYKPVIKYDKKIESGINNLKIALRPTPKIINCIKKISPAILLVGFKFAPNESIKKLFDGARELICRSKLDLVVANTIRGNQYKAYILNNHKISGPFFSRESLVSNLVEEIRQY